MTPIGISAIVFACLVGGALLGMLLAAGLPGHHLDTPSKEVVRLGMGLIATMAALVLGLVIASAHGAYDEEAAAVRESAADVLLLDRALAEYGPEAQRVRELLRHTVEHRLARSWPSDGAAETVADEPELTPRVDRIEMHVRALAPQNDAQRELRSRALDLVATMMKTRWLSLEEAEEAIPTTFLVVLVFWLTALFGSFGLFAPRNATVVSVLIVCALSVSASIFVILEMGDPFTGLVKVSGEPLRFTLESLGK